MTEPDNIDERLADMLQEKRPRPRREFRNSLAERLTALEARARRPDHLWWLVAAYLCAGLVLLLLAALGAGGAGPFGS